MGQYHYIVNADKRQFLHPHQLGDGLKAKEIAYSVGGTMTALTALLIISNDRGGGDFSASEIVGSWGGDRIAVVGDYTEDTDISTSFDPEPSTIYARCLNPGEAYPEEVALGLPTYRNISVDVRAFLESQGRFKYDGKSGIIRRTDTFDPTRRLAFLNPDMVVYGSDPK